MMRRIKRRLAPMLIGWFWRLLANFSLKSKVIIFESFHGKQFSCNPKAIYTYLQQHHPEFKLYWTYDQRYVSAFSPELNLVRRFSLKWFYLLGTSKWLVTNSRMPSSLPKPKRLVYLQTWHGTPLKKLAFDMDEVHMPGTTREQYLGRFYKESRNWDYLLSPSAYSSAIFKRAFQFEKTIVEVGYPRNDVLYAGNNTENIDLLKQKLNLPQDKKIILYAPTWRDDDYHTVGSYKFDLPLDLLQLQRQHGNDCVIVLRMHYLVAENFDLGAYEGFAYDMSTDVDISELYLVADLLITDYSSVFFDYANLGRPMLFYMYDIEKYRDALRGFYFDIESDSPGPIVKNMADLSKRLNEFFEQNTFTDYAEKYDEFQQKFCRLEDGFAAERFVKQVITG